MAIPLRICNISAKNLPISSGLYIIGNSNAREKDIPHLPTLAANNPTPGVENIDSDYLIKNNFDVDKIFEVFSCGDIVWFDSKIGVLRSILSSRANANTLLVTERCDNRCSFCSQPPNDLSDLDLYQKATLSLLNFNQDSYVGISGGEPTLNRSAFTTMLSLLDKYNLSTPLHILSNSRNLSDDSLIDDIMPSIKNRPIIWGIPLYGHSGEIHDDLVGAKGAFVETLKGIMNLGKTGQFIELRIIPLQKNLKSLEKLMEFIALSFPFVGVVSIMNLEPQGWAKSNFEELYVPVSEQNGILERILAVAKIRKIQIRLFNYPICLLSNDLREYSCLSISDWKNYYPPSCDPCDYRNQCGGFFTSATGKFLEKVEPIRWTN